MSDFIIPGRYDFSIPEAQRLADLSSIDADLQAVLRLVTRCEKVGAGVQKMPKTENDLTCYDEYMALGDLMFAAVIRYGRTYGPGVREAIPRSWIDALPEDLRRSHEYFKELRNKYLAHSVNQPEDCQVFVMLTPQFGENQEPTAITVDRGWWQRCPRTI